MYHRLISASMMVSILGLIAVSARAGDEDVRLSSIGFLPERSKKVSITGEAEVFTVRRAVDDAVVLRSDTLFPILDNRTQIPALIGDFSAVTAPGIYYVDVPGVGRSRSFPIAGDVYEAPFKNVMLGFYGWRSGIDIAFTHGGVRFSHAAGHLKDAYIDYVLDGVTGQAGDFKDGVGGWYDAGDYGKYVVNAAFTAGMMMAAWEDFGAVLGNVVLDIPESGGALPDFLDEIRYELDWMLKMQLDDGRVSHKLSGLNFPGLGVSPAEDGDNRYFSPYTTAATAGFTAAMAQASRIFKPYDDAFATACLAAAERSYAYLVAHPNNDPPDWNAFNEVFVDFTTGAYYTNDSDDRLWAAAELWATTGSPEALADFEARAADNADLVIPTFDWSNLQNLGFFTYVRGYAGDADRDPALVAKMEADIVETASEVMSNMALSAFGRGLLEVYWGGNGAVARTCMVLEAANRIAPEPAYVDACAEQIDYLYGRNMYGRSQVTGEGVFPPCYPHDRRSVADDIVRPYPGLLVGGESDPGNWRDDQESYETNEVANNWSGALVYALAGLVQGGAGASSVGYTPVVDDCTQTPPDPAEPDNTDVAGPAVIIDDLEDGDLNILSRDGRQGGWFLFDDGSASGQNSGLAISDDGANGTLHSMSIVATGYSLWGGGIGVNLNAVGQTRSPYDASAYSGVSFSAKANQPSDLHLMVVDAHTSADGGECTRCDDHFTTTFRVEREWQSFAFSWSALGQGGWGAPSRPAVDAAALYAIQFQWEQDTTLEFYIDDVAFTTPRGPDTGGPDAGAPDDESDAGTGGGEDAGADAADPMAGITSVDGTCACKAAGQAHAMNRLLRFVFNLLF